MKVRILMITHCRAAYTRLSLKILCDSVGEECEITVWDNASDAETRKAIEELADHPRIGRVIFNPTNDKLQGPTNWFWEHSADAEYIGKVDDDCLAPPHWCDILAGAHREIPTAGMLACWHFRPEDINESNAGRKIERFGNHSVMRNCWVQGSGYLMKRRVIDDLGLLRRRETFTDYCIRAAARGYVNGWYFPFLFLEHMDDPRSKHCRIKDDEQLMANRPLTALRFDEVTTAQRLHGLKERAHKLQLYSTDPSDFRGLRAMLKRRWCRLIGKAYFPTAH